MGVRPTPGHTLQASTRPLHALPWLILTDKDRKVVAEGFAVSELDSVVGKVK